MTLTLTQPDSELIEAIARISGETPMTGGFVPTLQYPILLTGNGSDWLSELNLPSGVGIVSPEDGSEGDPEEPVIDGDRQDGDPDEDYERFGSSAAGRNHRNDLRPYRPAAASAPDDDDDDDDVDESGGTSGGPVDDDDDNWIV